MDLALIDLVATPGELFFAVARVRGCTHGIIIRHDAPNGEEPQESLAEIAEDEMANRKPKTWKDVKAANAAWVEQEIREITLPEPKPRGAMAMLGFARRFRATRRSQEWMKELRGED